MISFISPDQFKTIPWKNGLGVTTELAISAGSSLANFDWRLSIATVTEDGDFSNFSGYDRNLVLIAGNGIALKHELATAPTKVDTLDTLLMISSFDGGSKTQGRLLNGEIKDFNIMTKQASYTAKVNTWAEQQTVAVNTELNKSYFAYSLSSVINVLNGGQRQALSVGHLLKVEAQTEAELQLSGENVIFIELINLA